MIGKAIFPGPEVAKQGTCTNICVYVCMYVSAFSFLRPGTHEVSLTPARKPVAQMPATKLPQGRHQTWLASWRIHPTLSAGIAKDMQGSPETYLIWWSEADVFRRVLTAERSQNVSGGLPALFRPHLQSVSTSLRCTHPIVQAPPRLKILSGFTLALADG